MSAIETNDTYSSTDTRTRIVRAAATLLREGGREAVTTRAVALSAGVQAPTIYRLFGDKDGLLDAVAEHLLRVYVSDKAALAPDPDPVQDLRDGWNMQTAFNLTHPDVFAMMLAEPTQPRQSPAAAAGTQILRDKIRRVAQAGRLKVSEARAESLIRAAGYGAVLVMLGQPEDARDAGLAEAAQEAVFAAILTDAPADGATTPAAAVALRASLAHLAVLSASERSLLGEWLDRIIAQSA